MSEYIVATEIEELGDCRKDECTEEDCTKEDYDLLCFWENMVCKRSKEFKLCSERSFLTKAFSLTDRHNDVECYLSRTPCRLRFPIGHKVQCFLGVEEGWKRGTVINHYYREKKVIR